MSDSLSRTRKSPLSRPSRLRCQSNPVQSVDEWVFTHKFDYIHTRLTIGCWSDMRTQIIAQAFTNLEPGGYFEAQELLARPLSDDDTLPPSSPWLNGRRRSTPPPTRRIEISVSPR